MKSGAVALFSAKSKFLGVCSKFLGVGNRRLSRWLFLVVRYLGNHEFPDHEKNDLDLDFLLLMGCSFLHEFPFFKIKQQAWNCFTRYLQRRETTFPDKQFLCLLGNHIECCAWSLKHLQHWTSHMTLKKLNLGIHDADKKVVKKVLKSFHDPSLP